MSIPFGGPSQNNKGTLSVVDKSDLVNFGIGIGEIKKSLHPIEDVMTLEFKAIQVLEYVEQEMLLIELFKSLLFMELFPNE